MTAAVQTFGPERLEGLWRELGVAPHPVLRLPTVSQVAALLATPGGREELLERLKQRARRIELARQDPLEWGFEGTPWGDADRLLKCGVGSGECGVAAGREAETCSVLGIFGGNRATKTWYAVKRGCQTAVHCPRALLLVGAESELTSIATVQALAWYYLGPRYKHLNGKRDSVYKINYSQAEGFTNRKLVLPNGSEIHFPTYNQDPGLYEGWEFGAPPVAYEAMAAERSGAGRSVPPNIGAVMDESLPLAWLKMLSRRLRFRKAKLLWPFTPVKGITPAIKELVGASAITVESRPAELLPRKNLPDVPEGHMPYIRKCMFPEAMAIYFFTQYNQFGPGPGRTYYDEVKGLCAGKTTEYIERVAYGLARDSVARAFPKFGSWNVVKRSQLPATGTNYMLTDPAGARNWATIWVRVAPGNPSRLFIYRDWPDAQRYGEWAVATEREVSAEHRKGWDGDPGPAQAGMGYGTTRYKQLFLEAERVENSQSPIADSQDPYRKALAERARKVGGPVQEEIAERYVDSRAGASEHHAEEGGTCIIEEFADEQRDKKGQLTGPSMELIPASGVREEEGITAVNELLDWNETEPLMPILNEPRLYVCEDCQQVRWMFENYTGLGGEKGACKDFADLVRYLALAELEYLGEARAHKKGRGF